MTTFVGIDLGTTNSAISTFDGSNVRVLKSPEQNDVTPSAILFSKRGKFVGRKAYDQAAQAPESVAMLFKRLIGTNSKVVVKVDGVAQELTPEECSADVLRTLIGYLTDEQRQDVAAVITVPAAFNMTQRDATMKAAESAGIGRVQLIQEPVAAVMAVMRSSSTNGIFVVYDLGGGTLDIAIAQNTGGHVTILAQGGVQMLGGRDFDRRIVENIVKPWLMANFTLPADFVTNPKYAMLMRMAAWSAEKAKIELSSRDETVILANEGELRTSDEAGNEIYFEAPLTRQVVDQLLSDGIAESVDATRKVLADAGITVDAVEKIVFVGGPTQYGPLREKVAAELGIRANTDVNPMTAVSEGAAVYSESLDWSTTNRAPMTSRAGETRVESLDLSVKTIDRTPSEQTTVQVAVGTPRPELEFELTCVDSAWTSGKISLSQTQNISVPLAIMGRNTFTYAVTDQSGTAVPNGSGTVIINRSSASVDAIPASHSIGIKVRERRDDEAEVLQTIIRAGTPLPVTGEVKFQAVKSVKSESDEQLKVTLLEGDIPFPVEDNRFIGELVIAGTDFDMGEIREGDEIACSFEMQTNGLITITARIDSIQSVFSTSGLYSPQEAMLDYALESQRVAHEAERTIHRIQEMKNAVPVPSAALDDAQSRIEAALSSMTAGDAESTKRVEESVIEAKKALSSFRQENIAALRRDTLAELRQDYAANCEKLATPDEKTEIGKSFTTLENQIGDASSEFDRRADALDTKFRRMCFSRDDKVPQRIFEAWTSKPYLFVDQAQFQELKARGEAQIAKKDIQGLRSTISDLADLFPSGTGDEFMSDKASIARM